VFPDFGTATAVLDVVEVGVVSVTVHVTHDASNYSGEW
jgi:hypothetical protein